MPNFGIKGKTVGKEGTELLEKCKLGELALLRQSVNETPQLLKPKL